MKYDYVTQLNAVLRREHADNLRLLWKGKIRTATYGLMGLGDITVKGYDYIKKDETSGATLNFSVSRKSPNIRLDYCKAGLKLCLALTEKNDVSFEHLQFEYIDDDGAYAYEAMGAELRSDGDSFKGKLNFYDAEAVKLIAPISEQSESFLDLFRSQGIVPDQIVKEYVRYGLEKKFNELAENPQLVKELLPNEEKFTR